MKSTKPKSNKEQQLQLKAGKKHAWFIEEIPKFKVDIPIVKAATLYLSEFDENKIDLSALLNDLRQFGAGDRITLVFNSPGGLVTEGKAIINTIKRTGSDIQTEIISSAASMAAIMFCIGDRRLVHENSTIMFHNYRGGVIGKGHEMEQRLEHMQRNLPAFFRANIIGLTDEEINQMFDGKDFWFGAKEMAKRGIATHIIVDNVYIPAKDYIKVLKKAQKEAKKEGINIKSIEEAMGYGIDVLSEIVQEQNESIEEITAIISEAVTSNELLYN